MGKIARIIAFLFRAVNFFFDCLQTWQYTGGGGMSGVIAAIIAFYQGLPYWMLPFVAVAAGVLVTILLALIFKSFAAKKHEEKRLQKLPRLVLDIHKCISKVRIRLINKTRWDTVDDSKVISPLLSAFGSLEINDAKISQLKDKLSESGSPPSGIASVTDAIMKKSDTSLEKKLAKDFWYRYLTAKLDGYKPYPNDDIGNTVSRITNMSLSINNMLVLQSYASPDSLSLETLDSLTTLSDIEKMQVYSMNVLAEEKMDDAIDKASTRLRKYISDYLKSARERK